MVAIQGEERSRAWLCWRGPEDAEPVSGERAALGFISATSFIAAELVSPAALRNRASTWIILCYGQALCLRGLHVEGDIHRVDEGQVDRAPLPRLVVLPILISAVALLILLFPDGRLPDRSVRAVPWVIVGGSALSALWAVTAQGVLTATPCKTRST